MDDLAIFQAAWAMGGGYGVAIAAVVVAVRLYRHDAVQGLLPQRARWGALPLAVRWGIVAAAATCSAWVTGLLAGQSIWAALGAAVVTAIGAMGGHKATQAIGEAQTRAAIAGNAEYSPSALRRATGIVLPLDDAALREASSARSRLGADDVQSSQPPPGGANGSL